MRNLHQYPLTSDEAIADLQRQLAVILLEDRLAPGSTVGMSVQMILDYLNSKPLTFEHYVRNRQLAAMEKIVS